jgi:hypothetical protein
MTTHPDFEQIRRFGDGSLPAGERAVVAAHLDACARCRAALASVPRLVSIVAEATELELPAGAWERILARRAAGERIIPPALVLGPSEEAEDAADAPIAPVAPGGDPALDSPVPPVHVPPVTASSRAARRAGQRSTGWTPGLRRAAVLVLGAAGVASAAVAVPLIRDWLSAGSARDEAPAAVPATPPAAAAKEGTEAPPHVAGVSILPLDGAAAVDVDAPDPALQIRIRVVDSPELEARAVGSAAAGAVFHPRPGRLRVQNAGAGELELLLPRDVPRITVRVDGEPYLVKEGAQIRVIGGAADSARSDAEVVLRVGRAP